MAAEFIVGRRFLTPLFYEDLPYISCPLSEILSNPASTKPPNPLLFWQASSLLRSETCGFLLVLWFGITQAHTHRHTAHTGADRLTHPYKYTLTPPAIYINTNITVTLTGIKFTEVWNMWFFTSTLIWNHTHTCTKIHNTHRGH